MRLWPHRVTVAPWSPDGPGTGSCQDNRLEWCRADQRSVVQLRDQPHRLPSDASQKKAPAPRRRPGLAVVLGVGPI